VGQIEKMAPVAGRTHQKVSTKKDDHQKTKPIRFGESHIELLGVSAVSEVFFSGERQGNV